ncbi:MAG: phytanoyl-CoA dioxygenase family protein [Acidimicrobiales bacterium]|nr:phytanoyl-CoA dioxygenase family protein [Acidimicrobiales bacterium]
MAVGNTSAAQWRAIEDVNALATSTQRPWTDLSPVVVENFQRDGVVILREAFPNWVEPLRAGLQRNLDNPQNFAFPCDSTNADEPGRFFDSYCNWQLIPEYLLFIFTSEAAAIAAQLMESQTAQFFHDHAFSKEPGTQKATPWHHDLPYYCVDGTQTVSIYVALDATPTPTTVRFLKGSHRDGKTYRPRNFASGAEYENEDSSLLPAPEVDPHGTDIFVEALSPGDAVCFDFRTLHGTTSAEIENRRRAFSTRWIGDDVRYLERQGETSPPLDNLGLQSGEVMRPDLFPVLWPPSHD